MHCFHNAQIVYTHEISTFSFDDMQYSEDPRLVYANYVEFRPRTPSTTSGSAIVFRSPQSSARVNKWNADAVALSTSHPSSGDYDTSLDVTKTHHQLAKSQHHVSFEFRVDIADVDGLLFSTQSEDNYFAVVLNDGYVESILSPHRVPNADSAPMTTTSGNEPQVSSVFFDRHQRLFASRRVNDGAWHKLEFTVTGKVSDSAASVGSFVLDDDRSSKIRFPVFNYWSDESTLVFGANPNIARTATNAAQVC
jgi:hypothetical protein